MRWPRVLQVDPGREFMGDFKRDTAKLDVRIRRNSNEKRLWLFIVVNNNKSSVFRLSHDVVTCDVDRDVSTAYC